MQGTEIRRDLFGDMRARNTQVERVLRQPSKYGSGAVMDKIAAVQLGAQFEGWLPTYMGSVAA